MQPSRLVGIFSKGFHIICIATFTCGVLWTVQHAFVTSHNWQLHKVTTFQSPSLQEGNLRHSHKDPFVNETKVALLIEDRPLPVLAPLILHFVVVLPPEWTVQFVGSAASIAKLSSSPVIQRHTKEAKIKITEIPPEVSIASQELISRFMTTLWLWENILTGVDIVLVFQTDSIICSKSHQKIQRFLHWDWIGAPWRNKNRLGGNGGLSLRRRAPILEILKIDKRRDGDDFEDVWFTKRLKKNGNKIAPRPEALRWSGESQLPDTLIDDVERAEMQGERDPRTKFEPMGYHIGNSGDQFHTNIWGTKELRDHVYSYCPEIKMLLNMDAASYVPGECQSSWEWGKNATLDHPIKKPQNNSNGKV